jgi:hypothetical protein
MLSFAVVHVTVTQTNLPKTGYLCEFSGSSLRQRC